MLNTSCLSTIVMTVDKSSPKTSRIYQDHQLKMTRMSKPEKRVLQHHPRLHRSPHSVRKLIREAGSLLVIVMSAKTSRGQPSERKTLMFQPSPRPNIKSSFRRSSQTTSKHRSTRDKLSHVREKIVRSASLRWVA